ncbi:MAG: peptidylprolyl isomerase [Candidatus Obscuribacterales bacterium]|nr:peptidylprolyl isomerase [Candidatus Obscuribacterales bacterium]
MNTPNTDPIVVMETNKGTLKIQIYAKDAPITSQNFLDLVNRGFYNGLNFHRYEPGFCLQGGCPKGTGTGSADKNIQLEVKPQIAHLKHDKAGVLAMARSDDPNSASCQFYFTLGNASFLDGNYAVFGRITEGMDVLMQMRKGDKMVNVSVMGPVHA